MARRQLREKVEAAVERLLAVLDDLDADPEAEPSLGAPEGNVIFPQWWSLGRADGREEDAGDAPELEDEHGDAADLEPNLGAPENPHDQQRWASGDRRDHEQDANDQAEPDGEGDPLDLGEYDSAEGLT